AAPSELARCPCGTKHSAHNHRMWNFARILVATDFSECSEAAANGALELARRVGANVTLFHAYPVPVFPVAEGGMILPTAETFSTIADSAHEQLAAFSERINAGSNVVLETVVIEGTVAETIVRAAQNIGADLIVVGTHGRTGLKHLLLGSVAEHVVRTASCP